MICTAANVVIMKSRNMGQVVLFGMYWGQGREDINWKT
jgi:hypothetical protein